MPDTDNDIPYIIDLTGVKRFLAKLPPTDFGKLKSFRSAYPIADRKDWFEVNNRDRFGSKDWILNQAQHNSCVGNGAAGAARRSRVRRGLKDVKLSPAWIYSLINGNRDAGAIISDSLKAGQKTGFCRFDIVGQDPVFYSRMPAAAKTDAANYLIGEAYHCPSYEELCTAILLDFDVVYGIRVGSNFGRLNSRKIAPALPGQTNHCMAGDGLVNIDGEWCIDNYNSWDWSFGDQGRCYLTDEHFAAGDGDFFAIRYMNFSASEGIPVLQT